jgi:putative hydrolase of the HAD superfamily
MKPKIQVSFDFDGVLAKSPFARCALLPALEGLAREYISRVTMGETEAFEELKRLIVEESNRRLETGRYVEAYDWDDILSCVTNGLNLSCDLSLADMVSEWCNSRMAGGDGSSLLYPNAQTTLKRLKERGARIVLLTNGFRAYQVPFLEVFDLEKYFDAVFTADGMGYVKPYRQAFNRAFRSNSYTLKIHVGDRLLHDVSGAKNAQITSIWLHRKLPESLIRLDFPQRNNHKALEPILTDQLAYEEFSGPLEPRFFPDLIIGDLEEIIPAVNYLESGKL